MKLLRQFLIIAAVALAGEALNALIPLPIPASVYGLVLMFVLLLTRVVKLEQVKTAASFFIEIMPVMFIPAAVALMDSWGVLRDMLVPVLVIMVVSTFVVMGVTGLVTQAAIRRSKKEGKEDA